MKINRQYRLACCPDRQIRRILLFCGLFLGACELYKQLFLYYIMNGRHYNWWFFPFQLCSLPIYLCLAIPFLKAGNTKTVLCTFLQDFTLLGGIAALVVPEGFSHIHWTLTLHGYVWHILLILIGLFVYLSGQTDLSRKGYLRTLPFFALCCAAATAINLAAPGRGEADMFYISPYHASVQPVFGALAERIGILPSHLLYLLTICLGAYLIHCLFAFLKRQNG